MAKVLVVYASLTGNTKAAADAVAEGARAAGAEVALKSAEEAQRQDLLDCDAVALGSYDIFDSMASEMQLFLERATAAGKEPLAGKRFGAFLTYGGTGRAIQTLEAVAQDLKFKSVTPSACVKGFPDQRGVEALKTLGARLAESAASAS